MKSLTIWHKLSLLLTGKLPNREALDALLHHAEKQKFLDAETLHTIEGALHVSEMRVGNIMIPRSQMVAIDRRKSLQEFLPELIESHHSRFPVYDGEPDEIEGVLLAKDLLPFLLDRDRVFNINHLIRPPLFVPEGKRLDTLLATFRSSKNHMAIVVDEYGSVSGLVTIEDILEQIVGEIEDEHDIGEKDYIKQHDPNHYTLKALLPLEDFNNRFPEKLKMPGVHTLGGFLSRHLGHVPQAKEKIVLGIYTFTVLHADPRRVHVMKLSIKP